MNDEDSRRVREAQECAVQMANSFFESLTDDQRAAFQQCAESGGRCDLNVDHEEIASAFEDAGILPRDQYFEMTRIKDLVKNGKTLSEPELYWMFKLLSETDQTIVRARVLALLEVLLNRVPDDLELAARVEMAIAPLRQSAEVLDILHWGRLRQILDDRAARA